MDSNYEYTDLEKDQIRILHIKPYLDQGLLQGSLQNVALKDAEGTFVAVSWTWGKETTIESYQQVKIDGQLFSVRPNLWEMLNAFRAQNKSLSLWIDAVCINQDKSKPQEKNIQIPMMADIYKAAREVYVWLGPSADDSDYVMEILRSNDEEAYTSSRFVSGLLEVFLRPWWTRTWILQEYVLNKESPEIFCGQAPGVSAELMLNVWRRTTTQDAVSRLRPDFSILRKLGTISWLHNLRDSRHNPDGVYLKRNLRNALLWLKGFQVTEPRDKIYGALGLIETENREQFVSKVGVHTDKSTTKVYLDAMIYLLECEKTSTIFYDFPVRRQNAPSWVPEFDVNITSAINSIIRLGDVTSDHLDTPREEIDISEDYSTMSVRGLIFDQVSERIIVGDEIVPGWDSDDDVGTILRMPHLLHGIQDLIHQTRFHPCLEQLTSEPLWKTLIAGCYGSIEVEGLEDEVACQQRFDGLMSIPLGNPEELPQGISWNDLISQMLSMEGDIGSNGSLLKTLQNFNQAPHILACIRRTLSTGRTFFAGEGGYYGISEAGTKKGDLTVLLFPDHFIPFILRERGDAYEMVSVAYLPGPMREATIAKINQDRKCLKSFDIV